MSKLSHLLGNVVGENRKVVVDLRDVKSNKEIKPGCAIYWLEHGRNKIVDVIEIGTETQMHDALRTGGSYLGLQNPKMNNAPRTSSSTMVDNNNNIAQSRAQKSNINKRNNNQMFSDEKRPRLENSKNMTKVAPAKKSSTGKFQATKGTRNRNGTFDPEARRKHVFEVLGLSTDNDPDETQYESPVRSTVLRSPAFSDDEEGGENEENTLSSPKSPSIFNPNQFHDYFRQPPSALEKNKVSAAVPTTKFQPVENTKPVHPIPQQSNLSSNANKEYNPPPLRPTSITNVQETPRSHNQASKIRLNVTMTKKAIPTPSLTNQNRNERTSPCIHNSPPPRAAFEFGNRSVNCNSTLPNNFVGHHQTYANERRLPEANGHYTQENDTQAEPSPIREQTFMNDDDDNNWNDRNRDTRNFSPPRSSIQSRPSSSWQRNDTNNESARNRNIQNQNQRQRDIPQQENVVVPVGILNELMNRISQIEKKAEKSLSILSQGFPLFADTKHDHRPGEIHIGSGVYINETDHLAVENSIGKPLEAVKKLAICVFGRDHLATHNRTGLKSNAHQNLEAKGKLDKDKLNTITSYIFAKFRALKADRMHLGFKGKMVELTLEDLGKAVGDLCSYLSKRRQENAQDRQNRIPLRPNANSNRNNNNNNSNSRRNYNRNSNSPENERRYQNRDNRRVNYREHEENDYDYDY